MMLQTKYKSSTPCGYGEENLQKFSFRLPCNSIHSISYMAKKVSYVAKTSHISTYFAEISHISIHSLEWTKQRLYALPLGSIERGTTVT